jgi:hypothetical protein
MNLDYKLGYYSHSVNKYGKHIEKLEYGFLKSRFYGHIICPNRHIGRIKSCNPYYNMIAKADIIFVSEFNDNVGLGVYEECKLALTLKKPVYIIRCINEQFCFFKLSKLKKNNKNGNKQKYGKLIPKKSSPKKLFT